MVDADDMSRRENPSITVLSSVKANAKIAEARRTRAAEEAQAEEDAAGDTGTTEPRSKAGVNDSAASRHPADGRDGVLPSSGGGASDDSGAGSGTGAFGGAEPTAAHATIIQAQGALADRFSASIDVEGGDGGGRTKADVLDQIEQARSGLPANELRESTNSAVFDAADQGTGTTGIAAQGTDAVGHDLFSKEGRVKFMKDIFGGGDGTQEPGGDVEQAGSKVDVEKTDTALLQAAGVIQSNLTNGDNQTAEFVRVTPGGTVIEQTNAGVIIASMENGKVVRKEPDGTQTVIETDRSSTTKHPNGDVTETPPPKPPVAPGVSTPDPDDDGDRFKFVSDGLKERLGPKGVDGDGDIDFGDDVAFGVGAGAQLVDPKGALIGDPGRASGVGERPATSGTGNLDPGGNAGAIDNFEETPFGGGLEDDPLAGSDPLLDLDDARRSTDDDDDDSDSSEGETDDKAVATE